MGGGGFRLNPPHPTLIHQLTDWLRLLSLRVGQRWSASFGVVQRWWRRLVSVGIVQRGLALVIVGWRDTAPDIVSYLIAFSTPNSLSLPLWLFFINFVSCLLVSLFLRILVSLSLGFCLFVSLPFGLSPEYSELSLNFQLLALCLFCYSAFSLSPLCLSFPLPFSSDPQILLIPCLVAHSTAVRDQWPSRYSSCILMILLSLSKKLFISGFCYLNGFCSNFYFFILCILTSL